MVQFLFANCKGKLYIFPTSSTDEHEEIPHNSIQALSTKILLTIRGDVKIPAYKPHTNHKRSSVRSHTLAPTSICDLSHSLCWIPLTDLGHIGSVTYVCHPLWFVCGHRKGILTSPLNVCVLRGNSWNQNKCHMHQSENYETKVNL